MIWHDDSWKDSYDAWKLASPDDDREACECQHETFDIDIEGIAHCEDCLMTWPASSAEIITQRERQQEYDKWCRRQERREFWQRLTYPIRWRFFRLLQRVWPRKACSVLVDDEIPF